MDLTSGLSGVKACAVFPAMPAHAAQNSADNAKIRRDGNDAKNREPIMARVLLVFSNSTSANESRAVNIQMETSSDRDAEGILSTETSYYETICRVAPRQGNRRRAAVSPAKMP